MTVYRLWLVRHAKSDWEEGVPDFERGLNARGHRDGPFMAAWLSSQPHRAEWIWSSTANRALTTSRYLAQGWGVSDAHLIEVDALYHAAPRTAFEVLSETPPDITAVAVVFHNPGITALVNLLAGGEVLDNLPTLGIAEFSSTLPWSEVHSGAFKFERIVSPKLLRALQPKQS